MAENKKSFVLYADLLHTVEQLPDETAGKLFKIILEYVNDENPEPGDLLLKVAFEPIKRQLKRDLKEWEDARNKRSEGGKKGMAHRWEKITKDNSVKEVITPITVNVTDTVNVTGNVKRLFTPPTKEDVCNEMFKKLDDFTAMGEAEKFIDFYTAKGWVVGRTKMKDWKSAVRNWIRNMNQFKIKENGTTKIGTSAARNQAATDF